MVELGKCYFHIECPHSGHVFDVHHRSKHAGAKVMLYKEKNHFQDNQLWYVHPLTTTIRSKHNHFCLDVEDDKLVMNPYKADRPEQKFRIAEERVVWEMDPARVAGVIEVDHDKGVQLSLIPRGPEGEQRFLCQIDEKAGNPPLGDA